MRSTETPDLKITINRNSYHLANLPSSGISAKVLLKAVEQVTGIPSNNNIESTPESREEYSMDDDIFNSTSAEDSFQHATLSYCNIG